MDAEKKLPLGIWLVIGFLILGMVSAIYNLLFGEFYWFVYIMGVLDGVIAYGLFIRRKYAYVAFLIYALLVIILGIAYFSVITYLSHQQGEFNYIYLVFFGSMLALWITAFVYMRRTHIREIFR